jgi:hypothetical protein
MLYSRFGPQADPAPWEGISPTSSFTVSAALVLFLTLNLKM